MQPVTAQEVMEKAQEYHVKFVRLQFTDIQGSFKNIAVTVEELARALQSKVGFDSAVLEGQYGSRQRDVFLKPDPVTFQVFPWRPREGAVARLICDVVDAAGRPYPGCVRSKLRESLQVFAKTELDLTVGAEIEFFLFHTDQQGRPLPQPHDSGGICDLTPIDLGENARRDMVLTLEEMGFQIVASHHENAPGQHEIVLREESPLSMADKIATFKFVVRTIAQRHGLHASFMPKPLAKHSGSGMALNLCLWRQDANVLDDPAGPYGLSSLAGGFIAGITDHASAITAVANPLVNSYKRLGNSELDRVLKGWSEGNRNSMMRVPARRGQDTRLILRSPDATCNPYLTLSLIMQAALKGIEEKLPLPVSLDEDVTLDRVPRNLGEALEALSQDRFARQVLGDHIYERYMEIKRQEWDEFHYDVHPWELARYLTNY
ncbi:glutamine synthetase family protein [Desulforamulus hydrothermalis]|uniref:Glutamine synthetase n=1 Tax=Desulforamulus hydrothermalis Lam5 = DSM 18033 TaxID=1121428 RepID=K8EHB4_9FIRM|nr:glutamine synthetase family protein [Desulforamulus hydrothermalis]CCO08026.1 Glutamine synthetase [Desulforamulus hydrothermalis Lam5 = DSM 18033]SHG83832.1 glutamine synthetase [Desulforamulus hydrothermalis Lam5 = DSM 18033]